MTRWRDWCQIRWQKTLMPRWLARLPLENQAKRLPTFQYLLRCPLYCLLSKTTSIRSESCTCSAATRNPRTLGQLKFTDPISARFRKLCWWRCSRIERKAWWMPEQKWMTGIFAVYCFPAARVFSALRRQLHLGLCCIHLLLVGLPFVVGL